MIAEGSIGLHVVDDDEFAVFPDFVANGGLDLELTALLQAEVDVVTDGAADPAIRRDAGDRHEAHAGNAAYRIQNLGHRADLLDGIHICLDIGRHDAPE
jgi:hypothetical protein